MKIRARATDATHSERTLQILGLCCRHFKGSPISGGIQPRHEDKGKGNGCNTQRTHAADPRSLLPPFLDDDAPQL